ncbi:MAG: hypothetical protein ABS95_02515 [Verrucomicrobia bacterium SCN 57-15]|nr:MAG: hypothetical protein ABS95_02515 [Verrucomicrobia bacterium SCN 57-15]
MIAETQAQLSTIQEATAVRRVTCQAVPIFTIPKNDELEFSKLPDEVRRKVRQTLHALHVIHHAINKQEAIRHQARLMHHMRGFSAASLTRKYYAFLESNCDWTVLIDRAKAGRDLWNTGSARLPEPFIEFWRMLCERNQRKLKPAHRELLQVWRTHRDFLGESYSKIPGYDQWPVAGPNGIPSGWSYDNLHNYKPSDFELDAARIGLSLATQKMRQIHKTRVGLAVGEFFLFDDQEYDVRINFPGSPRAMRPLGLNALDLFSASCFSWGLKPTLVNDEGAKQKLREIDMVWFVVDVLTRIGYNPRTGTTLVVEHGTAAIRHDFEERILFCTGHKVKVDRSGIHGNPAFAALYEGAAKGNPRFKAPLESFFNLVRNDMAMLPGQVGKDRDHSPDELHGREAENNRLLKASLLLPPEQAAMLRFPVWNWHEFQTFAIDLYNRINSRTDHDLEGWVKAGLTAEEWRMHGANEWLPRHAFLKLTDEQQRTLQPLIETRSRKLSPQEVFNMGRGELERVQNCYLPDLLGPKFAIHKKISDGYFTIVDHEIDPDPMRFPAWNDPSANVARAASTSGTPFRGNNGDSYLVYLNPFNPSSIIIADPLKNTFIAELPREFAASWNDAKAIQKQLGDSRRELAERLRPLGIRHAPRAKKRAEDTAHNAAVLANATPLDPRERARAIIARGVDKAEAIAQDQERRAAAAAALETAAASQPQEETLTPINPNEIKCF